jgi:HAE1 family hydrophobic/amphiphilic exporter-1
MPGASVGTEQSEPEDIRQLEVRNDNNEMVPIGTVADVRKAFGPQVINRYNLYPTASISGEPAPGYSTGQALDLMEQIAAANLPSTMGFEWTSMAFEEKKVGGEAILVFAMAVLLVYLVLAAQYESWLMPAAVIMVVPLGILGAIAAVSIRGMDNKHLHADRHRAHHRAGEQECDSHRGCTATPIVRHEHSGFGDRGLADAVPTDSDDVVRVHPRCGARFRTGAGARGQQALGTAVFGRMLASTILAVFFVPVFFVIFQR